MALSTYADLSRTSALIEAARHAKTLNVMFRMAGLQGMAPEIERVELIRMVQLEAATYEAIENFESEAGIMPITDDDIMTIKIMAGNARQMLDA